MSACGLILALSLAGADPSSAPPLQPITASRSQTMSHAVGTFEVQITPIAPEEDAPAGAPGRMRLTKTFHGDLQGEGAGEMLGLLKDGSGAYVAMERVSGVLEGRRGAFALVHRGVMEAGAQDLLITIVPGSGEGELAGIAGVFHLKIEGGLHRYELQYSLP
jgi:hypothetical protein